MRLAVQPSHSMVCYNTVLCVALCYMYYTLFGYVVIFKLPACLCCTIVLLVLVLLIMGEGNQACYSIKYKIKLINIIHNIVPMII